MPKAAALPITGDADADRLLEREPLALLIGMLLDQQVPMERAFRGPWLLEERIGGLDATAIARALTRVAHEITERNEDSSAVAIVGIPTGGVPLAKRAAVSPAGSRSSVAR